VIICPGCDLPLPKCECDEHPALAKPQFSGETPTLDMPLEPGQRVIWSRYNADGVLIERVPATVQGTRSKTVKIIEDGAVRPAWVKRHNLRVIR
jgi:hypothetical protein